MTSLQLHTHKQWKITIIKKTLTKDQRHHNLYKLSIQCEWTIFKFSFISRDFTMKKYIIRYRFQYTIIRFCVSSLRISPKKNPFYFRLKLQQKKKALQNCSELGVSQIFRNDRLKVKSSSHIVIVSCSGHCPLNETKILISHVYTPWKFVAYLILFILLVYFFFTHIVPIHLLLV